MSTMMIQPQEPQREWLDSYFVPGLLKAHAYHIDTPDVAVKLDQNESPWDWPQPLKQKILTRVGERPWNRYPEAMGAELHRLLASYVGVPVSCLVTSPGSNMLIPLILDTMGRNAPGKVVIARPSFSLFEMVCHYSGIAFDTWDLDDNFDYCTESLPSLPRGSLVVFASPNNPTGTSLDIRQLEDLLRRYPDSMFLADEAYFEFNDQPYIELLKDHSNLMILRTMSKTLGAAGLRFGYLIASEAVAGELNKVRLPFLLNHFTMEAVTVLLSDPEAKEFVKRNVTNAISERERVSAALQTVADQHQFRVLPSKANFLLLQWHHPQACELYYQKLIAGGVLIRNISKGPGLVGCLRATIGTKAENDRLLSAIIA